MSPVPQTNTAKPSGVGMPGRGLTRGPVRRRLTATFLGAGASAASEVRPRLVPALGAAGALGAGALVGFAAALTGAFVVAIAAALVVFAGLGSALVALAAGLDALAFGAALVAAALAAGLAAGVREDAGVLGAISTAYSLRGGMVSARIEVTLQELSWVVVQSLLFVEMVKWGAGIGE